MSDHPLLDYLLAVLASVMTPALNDPALARAAAQQAIDAYQPKTAARTDRHRPNLAFALTALEALRLAASEAVSPSLKLKLRSNANGLNRAARDNARILDTIRETVTPLPAWHAPEPPPATWPDRPASRIGPAR